MGLKPVTLLLFMNLLAWAVMATQAKDLRKLSDCTRTALNFGTELSTYPDYSMVDLDICASESFGNPECSLQT